MTVADWSDTIRLPRIRTSDVRTTVYLEQIGLQENVQYFRRISITACFRSGEAHFWQVSFVFCLLRCTLLQKEDLSISESTLEVRQSLVMIYSQKIFQKPEGEKLDRIKRLLGGREGKLQKWAVLLNPEKPVPQKKSAAEGRGEKSPKNVTRPLLLLLLLLLVLST